MEMLYELLEFTAWEMTEPKPYGLFHILFVLMGGGLCLWAAALWSVHLPEHCSAYRW